MEWILFLSTGLLLTALALLWIAARQRRSTGLPQGDIRYSDTGQRVEKTLYDPISGLAGKPDYLVEAGGALVPVEVKSGRAPAIPHDSHIFQLAAYCRLVERVYGQRPPYGILRYRDRSFPIPYTQALENQLDALLADMRRPERKKNSSRDRSHEEPARCARCGYRGICDQRL